MGRGRTVAQRSHRNRTEADSFDEGPSAIFTVNRVRQFTTTQVGEFAVSFYFKDHRQEAQIGNRNPEFAEALRLVSQMICDAARNSKGTGGSRSRAGRSSLRQKCEHYLQLDIRQLKAQGRLQPGSFRWQWLRDNEPLGEISIAASPGSFVLSYGWTPHGAEPRKITQQIALAWTPCRFGGRRAWFLCPNCSRRCAVVYGVHHLGGFSCRHCMNLGYDCEAEDAIGRFWRKQHKLEARLGADGEKPKWMRWQSYNRLCERIDTVEEARIGALIARHHT